MGSGVAPGGIEFRAAEGRVVIGEQPLVANSHLAGFDKHPDGDPPVADARTPAADARGFADQRLHAGARGDFDAGAVGKRRSAGVEHDHAVLYGAFETHGKTPYFR